MGRTSIMMIIAFNVIFMAIGFRISSLSSSAYNKYLTYYSVEQASLAAESGANIAISNAYFARATPLPTASFPSGTGINGTILIKKVPIQSLSNDTIGFNITSTSTDDNSTVITSIRVQGQSFASFGMFTASENGIQWQSGDTCFGPYHTQDNITCSGTPRFYGQTTLNGKVTGGTPYFKYPVGANTNIPLDGNFDDLKAYGAVGGANYTGVKVFVQFNADGTITVRTVTNASTSDGWLASGTGFSTGTIKACSTYANVAALTSNGVLLVNASELHVKGVLNNVNITLGCIGTGSQVMIDSSLVYKQPPPCSRDQNAITNSMLGIVAENYIYVTDTQHPNATNKTYDGAPDVINYAAANNNNAGDVTINASMYSSSGGFGAENYSHRGNDGTLRVVGGIQESKRMAVASGTTEGFLKSYDYDKNLQYNTPVAYPSTRFLIYNWTDSTIVLDKSFWQGENAKSF
jgi:hypothetical protein